MALWRGDALAVFGSGGLRETGDFLRLVQEPLAVGPEIIARGVAIALRRIDEGRRFGQGAAGMRHVEKGKKND